MDPVKSDTNNVVAYDQASLKTLRKHYAGLRDKASYDAFLRSAHELITKLGIEPNYIRMALTGKHSMLELHGRAAYQHREVPGGVEVGLLMDREDVPGIKSLLAGEPDHYSPDPTDFVKLVLPTWKDIPQNVLDMNEEAIVTEYKRQYGKKLAEQRRGSGTDNEAMRFAVVQGLLLDQVPNARKRTHDMDYFTTDDLDRLAQYKELKYDSTDTVQKDAHQALGQLYRKVEHWARTAQEDVFPTGRTILRRDPRNQGGYFERYHWAKIYPTTDSPKQLAFTVSVENGEVFTIKIDTVGLSDNDSIKQHFATYRGPYENSQIVKIIPRGEGLALGWDELLKITKEFLRDRSANYNELVSLLFPNNRNGAVAGKLIAPQNVIHYGPPGTGKTYGVFRHGVMLATGTDPEAMETNYPTQKDVVAAFDKLLIRNWDSATERIAFVTFHQAFSYEDFVEGLKPKSAPDGSVSYAIEPGLFKRIVARAMDNWLMSRQSTRTSTFEEALEQLKDAWERDRDMKFAMRTKGYEFSILGFTDTSIQFKKASGGTGHTLSLATLRDLYYEQRELKDAGLDIYYPGVIEKLRSFTSTNTTAGELKHYVLVIDEINRANISAVLGELITLLEPDKRRGADNHLEVMLPYSKEPFSIPPNLHVIGTMNTADRSVEALDTALRRRFSFVECPSKPQELEKLDYQVVGDVDLSKLLAVINARIEMLLDRDHHIGHSYFMNWSDADKKQKLRQVFKNNIIPLLQEYFYGDPVKVGMVLGGGFIEEIKKGDERVVAFAKDFKVDDIEAKPRYEFMDPTKKRANGNEQVPWSAFEKLAKGE